MRHLLFTLFTLLLLMPVSAAALVKQSNSGICHCPGGQYFERTQTYTAFDTLQACLQAGGRTPNQGLGICPREGDTDTPRSTPPTLTTPTQTSPYDRQAFGSWQDTDGDCHDTRAEMLMALSTALVAHRANGCTVDRGRWLDPYTDRIFTQAADLDIDHLVPLAWAWERGAATWTPEQRRRFANDPVNLFAVQASVNRSKGAQGPLEWLPPNAGFHCQYVLRFERVRLSYGLVYRTGEQAATDALRQRVC